MVSPEGFVAIEARRDRALVRADLAELPQETWWREGSDLPGAKGRGGAQVLHLPGGIAAVIRNYRRGGALGTLIDDRYASPDRAFAELRTLAALAAAGVPVVEPLAAVARRRGMTWRLRLGTALVAGARPLTAFLDAEPDLRHAAIETAARVVALAFAAGLDHPDLHPDNLVVTDDGGRIDVRLLDLDRARLRARLSPAARDRMLVRMARYLHKHADSLTAPPTTVDHLRFLRGLGLRERAERRRSFYRLHASVRRAVARHRVTWRGT